VLAVSEYGERADAACETGKPARHGAGWTIVSLPAEVDIANVDQVHADLIAAVRLGGPVVIADLRRTSFCDCAGVSLLMAVASQARRTGAEIRIVASARSVLRTFELTGVPLAMRVYPTMTDAQRGPPSPASTMPTQPKRRGSRVAGELVSVDLPRHQVSCEVLELPVGVLGERGEPLECRVRRAAVLADEDPLGLLDDGP
jgi:anti-sigma B factor antagonist